MTGKSKQYQNMQYNVWYHNLPHGFVPVELYRVESWSKTLTISFHYTENEHCIIHNQSNGCSLIL